MRKLLFDKLINKNLWKIIAPQWMKAPPLTATKISQFRLVYGIMDKMDVTAQPKNPVSHTNTTIQIHTYKRLASSIAKSFALSVDEFALFQFNSIQLNLLLCSSFLFVCTLHLINDECPKDHLTVGHHYHKHKHTLSLRTHAPVFFSQSKIDFIE